MSISVVTVGKLLEGALEGDLTKVRAYAELIADNLEKDGEDRQARIIRSKLDGSYKDKPKAVVDGITAQSTRQSIIDSLNLLNDLVKAVKEEDYDRAKKRIDEYGYIAETKHIYNIMQKFK